VVEDERFEGAVSREERVMLLDGASAVGCEQVWAGGGEQGLRRGGIDDENDWQAIDRSLRRNARWRAAIDADDARLLREAERVQIWKPLGMVNMTDYLERVLGWSPRTAQQRMQVARALEHLPEITDALASGELPFSAVRELVRVATPSTEAAWRAHVDGMNLRQIEEAVAGHKPGDMPTDAPDPELRTHRVVLELSGAAYALWRQAALALDEMHEGRLDDDARATAMATAVLERREPAGEPDGRASYQIALTVCRRCDQAWQEGGGVQVPVDAATLEQARCDAQHIGGIDGDAPERAYQDIPPSVDRFVRRRDGNRCQTPGCRSALGLQIHHIVHREHGGTHDPSNLTLRCWSCHDAHHRGLITISGTAPHAIVTTRHHDAASRKVLDHTVPVRGRERRNSEAAARNAHVGAASATKFDQATLRTQARDALVGLGWKPAIATAAVDEARAAGHVSPLETLIREALRRCPMPR
jgi:hypothetical protein